MASVCARNAAWSRHCTRPAVARSSPSRASTSRGDVLMPCGRCRQLLWEHGGPDLLVDTVDGPKAMIDVLPLAFGREHLG